MLPARAARISSFGFQQRRHRHDEIAAVATFQVARCLRHLNWVDAMFQIPVDASKVIAVDDLGCAVHECSPLPIGGDLQPTIIPAANR